MSCYALVMAVGGGSCEFSRVCTVQFWLIKQITAEKEMPFRAISRLVMIQKLSETQHKTYTETLYNCFYGCSFFNDVMGHWNVRIALAIWPVGH